MVFSFRQEPNVVSTATDKLRWSQRQLGRHVAEADNAADSR